MVSPRPTGDDDDNDDEDDDDDPQVRRRPHQRVLGRHGRPLRRRVSEDDWDVS